MKYYGIWDADDKNWVREAPNRYNNRSIDAILAFTNKNIAKKRAAEYFGYDYFYNAKKDGWCEVRELK